jgi:hypothetical protein
MAVLYLTIYRSIRPWAEPHINRERLENFSVSEPGILYHANIVAVDHRVMQYKKILQNTKSFHEYCIHIVLDWNCLSIELTFPSILPLEVIGDTIEEFLKRTHEAVLRSEIDEMEAEQVAAEWPEYVLPPSNPLSFLCSDIPCSFFGVE